MSGDQLLEKEKILSKNIKNKNIDIAIEMYQKNQSQKIFDLIMNIYQPKKYISYWRNKYKYLLDGDNDDFESEYMLCFIKALNSYNKNKMKVNSSFNNYFFSTISNHFKNKMSKKSCSKRNPASICPLCHKKVSPLNTHILRDHYDLIEKLVKEKNVEGKCPFCSIELVGNELYKHIASKHSSIVYEYFQKLFPNYSTAIKDPAPTMGLIYISDENTGTLEDINAQPLYYQQKNIEDIIVLTNLSKCQKAMKDVFDFYNISKLPSYKKLCDMCMEMNGYDECPRGKNFHLTKEIYDMELKDLIEKIK